MAISKLDRNLVFFKLFVIRKYLYYVIIISRVFGFSQFLFSPETQTKTKVIQETRQLIPS